MQRDSFIAQEKSAKATGIKAGDWFIASTYQAPYVVLQCRNVTEKGFGVVKPEDVKGVPQRAYSTQNCFVLDPGYTPDQLKCLQERSFKELEEYMRPRMFGSNKPMGEFKDDKE